MNEPTYKQKATVAKICSTLHLEPPEPFTKQQCQLFIALHLKKAASVWSARRFLLQSDREPSQRSLQQDADFIGRNCPPEVILDHLTNGGLVPRNMNGTREEVIARLRRLGYKTQEEREIQELRHQLEHERRRDYYYDYD